MNRENPTAGSLHQAPAAKDVFSQLLRFIQHPAIRNGRDEQAPLQRSAWNFIASVLFAALVTSALQGLLQALDLPAFSGIIRPAFLTLLLAGQALVFALLFWLMTAGLIALRMRGLHLLSFLQVLQSWAALNLLVVLAVWVALDRLFITVNSGTALSPVWWVLGGLYALAVTGLALRLLVIPVAQYLARFYPPLLAALFSVLIFAASLLVSSQLAQPFSTLIFDKEVTCAALNRAADAQGLPGKLPETAFIDSCLAQFR